MALAKLSDEIVAAIRADRAKGLSFGKIGRKHGCSATAAKKYGVDVALGQSSQSSKAERREPRLPDPIPEAGGPSLPESMDLSYDPFDIDTPGKWLILCDCHIPTHDKKTLELAVADARKNNVVGVLLNGDVLDFYYLSKHDSEPGRQASARHEIEMGRQFLAWLRSQLPQARIVFKEGNHDERLRKYLARKAPEIFDLEELRLENLIHAPRHGVEWVRDQRVINLGKLPIVHGHEFRGSGGVMPARWLYLRTGDMAAMGHFHRTSFYQFETIRGKPIGCWSIGCSCYLHPEYLRINQWNHGYALAELANDGNFVMHNKRVLFDGQVV